jgi:murein DD-endopeptidase MepM/ murein hydrolase activator NlpD
MNFDCKLTWRRKNLESLYAVRQGDTLARIAKLSGMTVKELDAINQQMAARHEPGSQPAFQPTVGEQLLIYSPRQ